MKGVVISLFDISGEMVKPWADDGYECHLFDIQHKRGSHLGEDGVWRHGFDLSQLPLALLQLLAKPIKAVFAFPPCTDVAVSGAKHMAGKGLRALQASVSYFATSAEFGVLASEMHGALGFMENPKTTMSTYWREPDYKFHPAHYQGYTEDFANYTKETWLWVFGDFVMPSMSMEPDLFNEPDKTYIHHQPPGEERANIRSKTPPGFPQAVFEANREIRE